jgi:hypothetical protein
MFGDGCESLVDPREIPALRAPPQIDLFLTSTRTGKGWRKLPSTLACMLPGYYIAS